MIKRFLLAAIALVMLFTAASCSSCNGDHAENNGGNNGGGKPGNTYPTADDLYKGTHERAAVKRNDYFMMSGMTVYKIVIPADYNSHTMTAATELANFVYEATEVILDITIDTGLSHSVDTKYISLGNTTLSSAVDVELEYGVLGESGYKIVTKDKSVFLLDAGQYGYGLLYAAYDLLYYLIGYEYYAEDTIVYEKGLTDINLYDLNITEVPDFEWRVATYNPPNLNTAAAHRYRVHRRNDGSFMLQAPNGSISHTLQSMFTRGSDPDDWFGDDGHQMCFSAHGNEASMEAFVQATCDRIISYLVENPQVSIFNMGQTDKNVWCDCPACLAERRAYGTDSAVLIKWANRVAEKVEQELEANHGGREFMLSIFAYHKTIGAPVKRENGAAVKDANGNYMPADESVRLRNNLAILLAIHNGVYTQNFYDSANVGAYENGKMWSTLTDNVYTWIYSTNFDDYLAPFNSFDAMQYTYDALKSFNTTWIHDQSQYNQPSPTGFSNLKLYLNSQLQWQVNQNYGKLVDKYFENYFGPAAAPMRKYFEELRTHMTYLEANRGSNGYSNAIYFTGITNSKYWPSGTLEKWQGYIDEAMASIESLKFTDSDLYDTLSKHIRIEGMCIRYLDIAVYKRSGNTDIKQAFKADCIELNITRWCENRDINKLFAEWGI